MVKKIIYTNKINNKFLKLNTKTLTNNVLNKINFSNNLINIKKK